MPRILMLTPYLPFPPVSGGRSRTYNLIRELQGRFDITLICFGRPEERAYDTAPLGELCELIVVDRPSSPSLARAAMLSATSVKPVITRLYGSPTFGEAVREALARDKHDVIHVESFYMLQNVPENVGVPVLLCEPAIEYVAWARQARVTKGLPQRLAMSIEARKLRAFEPRAWAHADLVGAMSRLDAASIQRDAPKAAVTIVPNGVDPAYFQSGHVEREAANGIYMGDYSYFPNVDAVLYFVDEIMPRIRAVHPDFTLTLLGKDAPPELVALGRDPAAGVSVLGLVDDTRPYLTRASVFVCPLRSASGTRFKLLESMACGCPVVSTTIGSEGLDATDGEHLVNADSADRFAGAVLRLLDDRTEAARLGSNGREWVQREHTWRHSAAQLVEAYARLARQIAPSPEHLSRSTLRPRRSQMSQMTARQRLLKTRSRLQHTLIPGVRYLAASRLTRCPCCRKPTIVVALGASDEFRVCVRCRGGLRYWMLARYIREHVAGLGTSTVLELDEHSPLRHVLGASGTYIRSYWSATDTHGSVRPDGARCEDISALTFEDESLDLIVSSEVLEHVPDFQAAMAESERVLRPGGRHIFTVPVRQRTRRRAQLCPDGTVEHLMAPEYHRDPLSPAPILAYWDIGVEDAGSTFSSPQITLSVAHGPTGRDGRVIWCAQKRPGA